MAEDTPALDLSQAVLGDGPALTPQGTHADGSPCFHGNFTAPQKTDGGQWRICGGGQDTLVEAYAGAEGADEGWFAVPNPCPACGAEGAVQVRKLTDPLQVNPDLLTAYSFRCTTCYETGPASPKPGSEIPQ